MTNDPADISDYQAARAQAKRTPTLLLWCLHRFRRRGGRGGRAGESDARVDALARELEARGGGRRRPTAPRLKGLP